MLFHTTIQAFARLAAAGLLLGNFLSVDAQELFLGSLRTLDHQVSGNVYLLSEKVIEVRDFTYDGTGPFAYFWADTNPTPSRGGRVLSDGLPSNNCATMVGDADLPLSEGTIQRVEFPGDSTIRDYLGGSFSVWCERFAANFGDLQLPDSLPEGSFAAVGPDLQCSDTPRDYPPIAVTPDGYNCEPLSEDYQVRWNINGNNIDVELVGRIPDDAYMSFGVSGRAGETFMINADVVVAVSESSKKFLVEDERGLTCQSFLLKCDRTFQPPVIRQLVLATITWMLVPSAVELVEYVLTP